MNFYTTDTDNWITKFKASNDNDERNHIFNNYILPQLKLMISYWSQKFKNLWYNESEKRTLMDDCLTKVTIALMQCKSDNNYFPYITQIIKNNCIDMFNRRKNHCRLFCSIDEKIMDDITFADTLVAKEPPYRLSKNNTLFQLLSDFLTNEKIDLFANNNIKGKKPKYHFRRFCKAWVNSIKQNKTYNLTKTRISLISLLSTEISQNNTLMQAYEQIQNN